MKKIDRGSGVAMRKLSNHSRSSMPRRVATLVIASAVLGLTSVGTVGAQEVSGAAVVPSGPTAVVSQQGSAPAGSQTVLPRTGDGSSEDEGRLLVVYLAASAAGLAVAFRAALWARRQQEES